MFSNLYIPFTELATITLLMLMIYWLRRAIGIIPVYLLIGLFFIFGQITVLPVFTETFFDQEHINTLTYGLLLLPVIMMYLIIYETEDTIEAQRFIFGMVVMMIAFIYITQLIIGQYKMPPNTPVPKLFYVMMTPRFFYVPLLLLTALHVLLLFFLPISYQWMRNMHCPIVIAMFLHIGIAVWANLELQRHFTDYWIPPYNASVFISLLLSTLFISAIAHIYIALNTTPTLSKKRSPFNIFTTLIDHIESASKMRQSVEEWAERYQAVFDNTIEMIFLVDESGAVINANHSAVSTFGPVLYNSGYIITDKIVSESGTPFDWKTTWDELQKQTEKITMRFSKMLLRMDESHEMNIEFNISPVKIYDSPMSILVIRDTTQEHKEEEERRKLEENLMHSQRLEAIGTLAGGIAHDFNNLIFGIQTSAEIIGKQEHLSLQAKSMLANIENATSRASDLTSKLLGFARKGKYQEKKLDIKAVARAAADLFQIGLKNVEFKFLAAPGALIILGDETQLQQVFLNILINAKDALKQDGPRKITLRIDRANEKMSAWEKRPENATSPEDYVTVRIKDTGSGMDAETLAHIFEPFYTTKEQKGNGLGLSMAYGCITHHHGWITISSEPNQGSEVTIVLPLV